MGGTILAVILNLLIIGTRVSSTCVHVFNEDMIEYSCAAGSPSDLYRIPEQAEKIRIANMSIPRITRDMFSRFGDNLWVLTCTYCDVSEIDDDAFASLTNLQQLRMDNNRLRQVKASWFKGMNYLTYLDFNYNEIENIEDGVYKNLPGLVDFRISGNRLQCLNIDAMSNLGDLKRIFLSKNPEFQCPNAVSKFLEDREVAFVKDPDWRSIPQDLIPASRYTVPSTPGYHEKLISRTTEDSASYDYEYPTSPPEVPSRATSGPVYPNQGWLPSSSTPYPQREWSTSIPTSATTAREWPASMPSSYPTRGWPTTESTASPIYPTRNWPTPAPSSNPTQNWPTPAPSIYPPHRERTEWRQQSEISTPGEYDQRNSNLGGIYGQTNYYPPEITQTSTSNPMDDRRDQYANYASYAEIATPSTHGTAAPPLIEWSGNSAEIFMETDYAPYENEPLRHTNPPAISNYPSTVHQIPITSQRPAASNDSRAPPRLSDDVPQPKDLDKYQQVQEPDAVTISPPQEPDHRVISAMASITNCGVSAVIVAICVFLRPFLTIL